MTRISVFIPHEVVFPGQTSSFEAFRDLLRTLSRTDTLMTCARFNQTLANTGHHEEHAIQDYAAHRFLGREELDRINAWAQREGRTPGDAALFFRGQMLELMCWAAILCEDLPNDGRTFESAVTRLKFARAALMISDAWGSNLYADSLGTVGAVDDDERVRVAAALRRGVALSSARGTLLEAIARASSLYGPELRQKMPEFERLFTTATGLSFEEYCALAGALAMLYGVRSADVLESNSAIFHEAQLGERLRPAARAKVPVFLEAISQCPAELAAAFHQDDPSGSLRWSVRRTYRPIRNRPLLRIADGRMVVLDPGMMCEALTMGPLFAAVSAAPCGKANELFGAFGDAVESYVTTLLRGMYPASPGLAPRLVVAPATGNKQQRGELCDAVLHGVDALALFEIKGGIIPDQHVMHPDPAKFRAEVLKRYASPGSKGTRPKGVTQLSRAIKAVSTGEAQLDGLRQGVTIYPVLITFDDLIEAPGTLHIIRNAFASELSTTTDEFPIDLNGMRVAQLTIMTVSDVELLDRLVKTTELLEVLRTYTATGAGGSFHDYLAENQTAFGIEIHGEQVTEIATVAAERTGAFLFGDQPTRL